MVGEEEERRVEEECNGGGEESGKSRNTLRVSPGVLTLSLSLSLRYPLSPSGFLLQERTIFTQSATASRVIMQSWRRLLLTLRTKRSATIANAFRAGKHSATPSGSEYTSAAVKLTRCGATRPYAPLPIALVLHQSERQKTRRRTPCGKVAPPLLPSRRC